MDQIQPQATTSTPSSLDPQVVNLAKAIRQTESGGDFKAEGDKNASHTSYGAYQFGKDTWNKTASKYGVQVPLREATPEQQNEVAYKQIKEWKDKGYNVGQISSMWNAGEGEPDAYAGKFSNGQPSIQQGKFDVPAYAKSVAIAYQTLKSGGQVQADPNNPSSTVNTQTQPSDSKGLLSTIAEGASSIFKDITKPAVTLAARPFQLAQTLAGQEPTQNLPYYGDISAPKNAGDVGKDVGRGLETVALGLPGEGITGAAGMGALQGTGQAIEQGKGASDIVKGGAVGGLIGGAVGGVGKLLGSVAQYLPERISRTFIPGINDETNKYAVEKGLGSLSSMYADSNSSLQELGTKLKTALASKDADVGHLFGNEFFDAVAKQFPDSGLTPEDVAENIKKLIPLKQNLVDKMTGGDMSLTELHELNSALGKTTFKTVFDDPAVKAGKQVGSTFYHTISDFLKTAAPESAPIFDDFTKELQLNSGLEKAMRRGDKSRLFTLRDLVALTSGLHAGGPVGAATAYAGERALTNPNVNLRVAGLLSNLARPTAQAAGNIAKRIATTGLVNRATR